MDHVKCRLLSFPNGSLSIYSDQYGENVYLADRERKETRHVCVDMPVSTFLCRHVCVDMSVATFLSRHVYVKKHVSTICVDISVSLTLCV